MSELSSGVLIADKPSPPTNLRVSYRNSSSITIQWDPPIDNGGVTLTGYIIEMAKGCNAYTNIVFPGNSNPRITTLTQTSLDSCQSYSYRIYSVNINGKEIPSSPLVAISSDLPAAPSNPPSIISISRHSTIIFP